MRMILITVLLAVFSAAAYAQGAPPLAVGEKQLNFGLGTSDHGIPTYVSLDFAVIPDITVSPLAAVYIDTDILSISAGAKGDYHFNRIIGIPSNFDFYAGVGIGVGGIQIGGDSTLNPGLDWGIHAGGRWYWSPKWGLNLELGGGNGYSGTLGVSMKL